MRTHLILILLALETSLAAVPGKLDLDLLQKRLELARSGKVFVTLQPDKLIVGIRSLDLKTLPITGSERVGPPAVHVSTILSVHPATPVKEVVEYVAEIQEDTTGAVSSLAETVSVEDMAANYYVRMGDGSIIVVTTDGLGSVAGWIRGRINEGIAALTYLRTRFSESGDGARYLRVRLSREHAREAFWLLREGTAVIF